MTKLAVLPPKTRPTLAESAASSTHRLTKERVEAERPKLEAELAELQELLFAAGTHSLLVVLQGMDTSGKDGTVKSVMDPVNPVGVAVQSFKVPSSDELAHDFLWRVHQHVPARGMISIFNRSHYEDVLVVRVHELVPKAVWTRRYRQIVDFERMLVENGTILMKFFLHISKKEQEQRLLEREEDVTKAWKLSPGDWKERAHWDEYLDAYRDAIERTGTSVAPWRVVPADHKWVRNQLVLAAIVAELRTYRSGWREHLVKMGKSKLAELAAFRGA